MVRALRAAVLASIATSCAGEAPITSSLGITLVSHGAGRVNVLEADAAWTLLLEETGNDATMTADVIVHFLGQSQPDAGLDELSTYEAESDTILLSPDPINPKRWTGLPHALAHMLAARTLDGVDASHSQSDYWSAVYRVEQAWVEQLSTPGSGSKHPREHDCPEGRDGPIDCLP